MEERTKEEAELAMAENMKIFEVGPCHSAYGMGYQMGVTFSSTIKSRIDTDLVLRDQLRPFALTPSGKSLVRQLCDMHREKYPEYWDELVGIAEGSGVPELDVILINFRKEILPFIQKEGSQDTRHGIADDCSDVLVVSDSMAIAAHNEDGNIALVGHTYLVRAILSNGKSFVAYTYAGELPSCAFGFNSDGIAFTLDSVPPSETEIAAGGIGRNFISRDLLEATSMNDALSRIRSAEVSVGHSYNLVDIWARRILNVETASRNRSSVHEVSATPFFHANMYLHLHVNQVHDESSISRQRKAASLPKQSKEDFLLLLGNADDTTYPIYMTGPMLYTLCTAVFDLDKRTLTILEGNPKEGKTSHVLDISAEGFKISGG